MNSNKKRIPNIPLSIDGAAKALDIDREYILTWLLDGSIRACINYRTYFSDSLTYSVAVLSDYTNIMEEFKKYRDDEFSRDCPLSSLLSTVHSTISINAYSVPLKTNDNGTSFSADLKGLWHINELTDVEELYDNMINDNPAYVNIIPYIPDSIYNSGVNDEMADYILGFNVEVSFDDICISYEDILRIECYLSGGTDLLALDTSTPCSEQYCSDFTPTEQLSMAFIQLILSNPNLGSTFIEKPTSSLRLIEDVLEKGGHGQLNSTTNTFREAITEGKSLLKSSNTRKWKINKLRPRNPYINKCKTLIQLIKAHPLIMFKDIDDVEKYYDAINQMLRMQNMGEFKVNKDVFQYVCELSR